MLQSFNSYHSQLTFHNSLLTTHYSLLTTHHSPLTSHHSLLTIHFSPFTSHHSLLTFHNSPFTTHLSQLTSHHSLLTTHFSPFTSHYSPKTQHQEPNTQKALLHLLQFLLRNFLTKTAAGKAMIPYIKIEDNSFFFTISTAGKIFIFVFISNDTHINSERAQNIF